MGTGESNFRVAQFGFSWLCHNQFDHLHRSEVLDALDFKTCVPDTLNRIAVNVRAPKTRDEWI